MNTVIEVRNLDKEYSRKQVLRNLNLTLPEGQIYGLIGKNGVGKTTLMRILTGLTLKSRGAYSLFGIDDSQDMDQCRRYIGTMIETPAFYPYMTAKENLEYYRIQRGIKEKSCIGRVLEQVNLTDTGKKQFKNFSLGMKQRLGLALALLNQPRLLILDEPINGLDPEGIVEIRNILKYLNTKENITVLISSHILSELASVATCYGFMKDGMMLEEIGAKQLEYKSRACVQVAVSDVNKVAYLLQTQLQCNAFETLPDNCINIYGYFDNPSIISDLVVLNGVKLYRMNVQSTDLEEYFLEKIGGNVNV